MIDQLIDRYINYASTIPDFVTNYIKTYGKDAKILQNDRELEKQYTNVFGSAYSGYSPIARNYEEVSVRILVDYGDFNKPVTDGAPTDTEIILRYEGDNLKVGDLINFDMRGINLTYKIVELSRLQDLFYRASLQLVINRGDRDE